MNKISSKISKKFFCFKSIGSLFFGLFIILNFTNVFALSDSENNNIYLFRAAKRGDIDWAKKLVEQKGANPNYKTSSGKTVLIKAVTKNRDKVINYLLDLKDKNGKKIVKIDFADNIGQTALHKAVKNNNIDIVKMLLDAGIKKDLQDRKGNTPLHIASRHGYIEVAKELILRGANLKVKNNDGDTPLHLASKNNYKSVAELIVSGGKIDLSEKNIHGKTPLECSKSLTRPLLQNGQKRFLQNIQ